MRAAEIGEGNVEEKLVVWRVISARVVSAQFKRWVVSALCLWVFSVQNRFFSRVLLMIIENDLRLNVIEKMFVNYFKHTVKIVNRKQLTVRLGSFF